eukprot:COSAG06_NODE_59161_length_275_cov_0.579545_1_plen_67_part_10
MGRRRIAIPRGIGRTEYYGEANILHFFFDLRHTHLHPADVNAQPLVATIPALQTRVFETMATFVKAG